MIGKNNPLNIRFNKSNYWKGLLGSTRGFCDFSSEFYGIRAAFYLIIRSYRKVRKDVTYHDIIWRYAPPLENNTHRYIEFVTDKLGVFPWDVPATFKEFSLLIYWMSVFEGNRITLTDEYLNKLEKEFKKYI